MNNNGKILFVVTLGGVGGAQKNVLRSAINYKNLGYTATIAAGARGYLQENAEAFGIPFIKLRFLKRSKNPLTNLLYFVEALLLFKKNSFNSIHIYSPNALVAALAARLLRKECQIRFTFGGLSILDPMYGIHPITRRILTTIYRMLLLLVDEYIFENHSNKSVAIREGIVSHGTVDISHLIVEEKPRFYSTTKAKNFFANLLGIDLTQTHIIGSIGRLSLQKNYSFLIHALDYSFLREKRCVVLIIGDGPEFKALVTESHTKGFKDMLFFPGIVEEGWRYLLGFDLFVLPSLYEGRANVLIECLFAGVPVIASNIPSNAETLQNSTEQLFSLQDQNDFRNKLKNLIENQTLRETLAKDNLKLSEIYLKANTDRNTASITERNVSKFI